MLYDKSFSEVVSKFRPSEGGYANFDNDMQTHASIEESPNV
jgi:hypothetical protein